MSKLPELIKEWRRNAHNIRLVLPDHGEAAVWDHCADELDATITQEEVMDNDTRARLTSEFSELSRRVKKMEKFVTSEQYEELDGFEQTDLREQLRYMRPYLEVLLKRVGRQANNG